MAATPNKQFDLVVFGATGDAGRAIALYLAKHAPSSCRWAIAGRNANKLHRVMKSLGESPRCKMLLASCDDMNSMTAMARDTRLVLSAAGPYTTLGEPVILACLAGEAHYVDITGELDWVAAMKAKYDTQARSKGLCICSFCGYDCIPAELSVFNAQNKLAITDSVRSAECVFSLADGGAPRGTLITILSKAGKPISMMSGLFQFVPAAERLSTAMSLFLWVLPWWSSQVNSFTIPHFMGWCNAPVVHASYAAERSSKGEGGLVYYQDRQLLPNSDRWWAGRGLVLVCGVYMLVLALAPVIFIAVAIPPVRSRLIRKLEQSYSYEGSETSQVVVYTRVTGRSGARVDGKFVCPGDAGIHCTALLAAETALTMIEAKQLPSGLTTPAIAVGEALTQRLRQCGVQPF